MKRVPLTEAKARLSALLDAVEDGETVCITRHGKIVARMTPATDERADRDEAAKAVRRFQEWRKTLPPSRVSVEDLLSARDEGRR